MIEVKKQGLLDDIWEDQTRKKRSRSALMRYRRNLLERFESNG